jgi:dihydrofolate reductase
MRKIILFMSVSLDGFIEGPDRQIDWHMVDDELHSHFNEQLRAMGAFLNGRVTYELMAGFWPTADSDPSSTGPMVDFAGIWRDMPKIVFSPGPWSGPTGTPPSCGTSTSRRSWRSRRSRAEIWRSVVATSPRPSCSTT